MNNQDVAAQPTASRQRVLACQLLAWSLSLVVSVLAVVAWGQNYGWDLLPINNYQLFPVLGLLAFSLMWAHYVGGTIRELTDLAKPVLARYFKLTSYAVLVLLCLHPGLLIYQLFRDGAGLPPLSYERYVAPGLGWVTLLGTVSLLVFLAFEFYRIYSKRSWWQYVVSAGDVAMLAILYHGLRLGGQLQQGWFRYVWFVYAVIFVAIMIRKYGQKFKKSPA